MASTGRGLRRAYIPILISVLLLATVSVSLANAAPTSPRFVPSLTPSCAAAGAPTQFTATITNSSSNTLSLGSARYDSEEGGFSHFTAFSIVSAPTGKTWTATVDNDDDGVYLRASSTGSALSPGQSLTATFQATAPSALGNQAWTTRAWTGTSFTGTSFALATGSSNPVTQVASACIGPPFELKIVTQGPAQGWTAKAGASLGPITVEVRDKNHVKVPTANNQVTLSLTVPGGAQLLGTNVASASAGTASFSGLAVDKVGTYTLTASSNGLGPDVSNAFTITPGDPSKVVLVAPDTTDLASGSSRNFMARVVDAYGNPTNASYAPGIDFTKTGSGTGTVIGLPQNRATNAGGEATSADITGLGTGPVTVTASASGLASDPVSGSATFNVVTGSGPHISFVSPDTSDLKSTVDRTFTVNVLDSANHLTGYNGPITFSQLDPGQQGAGSVGGLGVATASGGVATIKVTGKIVGGVTVQAAAAAPITADSTTFSVVHGDASQIVLLDPNAINEQDLKSGYSRNFTVEVQDANGNWVTDSAAAIDFTLAGGDATMVSGLPQTGVQAVGGHATSADVTGLLNGSVTVQAQAQSPSISGTPSATFSVVTGDAKTLTFTVQPSQSQNPIIEGTRLPDVAVHLVDGQGQPVTGADLILEIKQNPGNSAQFEAAATTLSGDATFSSAVMAIQHADVGYTLLACVKKTPTSTDCSDATVSAESDPFTVWTNLANGGRVSGSGGGTSTDVTLSCDTPPCTKAVSLDIVNGGGGIQILSTGTGGATFVVKTDSWQPEPAQNPVPATQVSPVTPTNPGPEPEVWCLGTYTPADPGPDGLFGVSMPAGHTWCLMRQESVSAGTDPADPLITPSIPPSTPLMVVSEISLLTGDAVACRKCG